ncbi:MAG: ABC transporter ATP-binding protein [Gammaproteobacteria bacterium]|nr:ABC transporter ATP-binding protein [Gammaproteobacteria bacterium]MBU1647685.1 ABC transporter ATP-binding protein [Gammaproteobacteria bacterium]MBU1971831.1 ABC transporter ATP-binding protein [Gammaproteobacteria bacterium]
MKLATRDLSVSIAGRDVCRKLDLMIEAGSRWAILGVNGVGKTTLLSTLAGLRPPRDGDILLDGAPIHAMAARERGRRLGLMVQEDRDDPEATVREVALLGRLPHLAWWQAESGHDEALARYAIEAVGLGGLEQRRAATLSGGERRRLALAALLAQEVPLLLLDEPTSHLDMHQQIALLDLLVGWSGRTLVMTLHEVNLAARYCTHVLLLFGDGQCCAGPVAEMLSAEVLSRLYRHPVSAVDTARGIHYFPG